MCPRLCQATGTGPLVKEGAVGPTARLLHEDLPLVISTQTHKKKNVQMYFPLTVLLPKSRICGLEHMATVSSALTPPGRFLHPGPKGWGEGGPTLLVPFLSQAALGRPRFPGARDQPRRTQGPLGSDSKQMRRLYLTTPGLSDNSLSWTRLC